MTDDVVGEVVLQDEDGFFKLPRKYANARKFVIRTPATTSNIPSGDPIETFWFDPRPDKNPELAPDKVSLKLYGEEPEIYRVTNPEIVDVDEDF